MPVDEIEAREGMEWLLPAGNGGYASGRVLGPRSRSYHGLFVAALPEPGDRVLVLAQVDERVVAEDGRDWLAACHRYGDGTLHPRGDRHLEAAGREGGRMSWRWRLGGLVLERSLELGPGNRGTLVWRILEGRARSLHLRPFCCWRSHHGGPSPVPELRSDGARAEVSFPGVDEVLLLAADRGQWLPSGLRHENNLLADERERGLTAIEDLDSPGELVWTEPRAGTELRLDFRLGRDDGEPFRWERPTGAPTGSPVVDRLRQAMLDFLIRAPGRGRWGLLAGYPWFNEWARDSMIALPGLVAALDEDELAVEILLAWAERERGGLLPNRLAEDAGGVLYNSADAPLWYLRALFDRAEARSGLERLPARCLGAARSILDAYHAGTEGGIAVDPADGLLMAGDPATQLTWMDARFGDEAMTPRWGKCVELQALYHEGLLRAAELGLGQGRAATAWKERAGRLAASFRQRFRGGPGGGLEDCVDGDRSLLRPNQVIALGSRRPLLDRAERARILAAIEPALLTARGLRSLAPDQPGYRGRYRGGPESRDRAYHQGTVWAWLIGPWVDAALAAAQDPAAEKERVETRLAGLVGQLDRGLRGQIGEIFEGDPPHEPVGAPAQAWSVAEILRVIAEHHLDAGRIYAWSMALGQP